MKIKGNKLILPLIFAHCFDTEIIGNLLLTWCGFNKHFLNFFVQYIKWHQHSFFHCLCRQKLINYTHPNFVFYIRIFNLWYSKEWTRLNDFPSTCVWNYMFRLDPEPTFPLVLGSWILPPPPPPPSLSIRAYVLYF